MRELTQERLREVLYYNPIKGIWTWRIGHRKAKRAGSISGNGYRYITIDQKPYRSCRLAFLYMEGEWPQECDHVNREPLDDRWCNLRNVSRSQNQMNAGTLSNNKSGVKGVSWHKVKAKFQAIIGDPETNTNKHLGYFERFEDAVLARARAERDYGYHEINLETPAVQRVRYLQERAA